VTALRFDDPLDDARRRRLLWAMPTGLYVLGATAGTSGPYNLMTCNLAVQVATAPCVVGVAVEVAARTHAMLEATGAGALCVLRRDQRALVRRFVKPVEDVAVDDAGRPTAMAGVDVALSPGGAPYLVDAAGCLELRVVDAVRFESHTFFCGEVVAVAVADEVVAGTASARTAELLRMEDTKMSYGG
jgi:flavin reductase (DIM6/NTAB) family NADH-FMN oxidoreductase RutF